MRSAVLARYVRRAGTTAPLPSAVARVLIRGFAVGPPRSADEPDDNDPRSVAQRSHAPAANRKERRAPPTPPAEAAVEGADAAARRRAAAEARLAHADRITRLGGLSNVLLALGKGAAGLATGSAALVADAAHSVGDLLGDGVTLWALRAARRPPDDDHPYGHGRIETLGALGVAAALLGTAAGLAADAVARVAPALQARRRTAVGCRSPTPVSSGAWSACG